VDGVLNICGAGPFGATVMPAWFQASQIPRINPHHFFLCMDPKILEGIKDGIVKEGAAGTW
jgi:hypothetical protein